MEVRQNSIGSDEFFDAIEEQRGSSSWSPIQDGAFPRILPPPSRTRNSNSPSSSPKIQVHPLEPPKTPSGSGAGLRLSLLSKPTDTHPAPSVMHSPGGKRISEKASYRRRHLDSLRRRMQEETDADFEEPTASSDSDGPEKESLASWGKTLLSGSHGGLITGTGTENFSTKASHSDGLLKSNRSGTQNVKKSSTLPSDASGSSGGLGNKSNSSYSTGSSKSGTMDRYETPESCGSKSSSLERTFRQSSLYVSSSSKLPSTLSREISLSGGETSLIGLEGPDLAEAIRRKNSEAAELIDQLTSQLVTTSTGTSTSTPKSSFPERPSSLEISHVVSQSPAVEPVVGRAVKNGNFQPDIIASTVKFQPTHPDSTKTATLPVAPPRRRKPGDAYSSLDRDDSVSISSLPTHSRTFLQPKSVGGREKKMSSGSTLPRQQSSSFGPGDTSCMDPISIEGARRMSLHPRKPNMSGVSGGSGMDSEDSNSTTSDVYSIQSMPVSRESGGYLDTAKFFTIPHQCTVDKSMDAHNWYPVGCGGDREERKRKGTGKRFLLSAIGGFRKKYGVRFSQRVGKTVHAASSKMKNVAGEVSERFNGDAESTEEEEIEDSASEASRAVRVRAKHQKKGPFDFEQLRQVQEIGGEHTGAVWCLKFSLCGRLLASAGQDNVMRVWVMKDAYKCFNDMRLKYNMEAQKKPSMVGNPLDPFVQLAEAAISASPDIDSVSVTDSSAGEMESAEDLWGPFVKKPFCSYRGHNADILDLAWSKNFFLLSSSMDKTVRLWHISRTECLCCFQHIDFVTSIAFLPKDDKFFLSGSLDGKLRVWNITEKKVALWNEVEGNRLITALAFVNNGKFAVAGTFDGKCVFYSTDQLKYHTMIDVKSSRGKNSRGHKVTGLSVYHDKTRGDKLLVTSNDSRVRLYDLTNLSLTCKYKGVSNYSSQIRAAFSPDGTHIVCGSEDKYVYVWRTSLDSMTLSVRKDRNGMWERIRAQAHNDVVTAAIFAPKPELFFQLLEKTKNKLNSLGLSNDNVPGTPLASLKPSASGLKSKLVSGDVIVTADFSGKICIFTNRTKLKAGGSVFFGI